MFPLTLGGSAHRLNSLLIKELHRFPLHSIFFPNSRHFGPFSGRFPAIRPINQLRERQEPAAVWHPGKEDGYVRSRDDGPVRTPSCQINPG